MESRSENDAHCQNPVEQVQNQVQQRQIPNGGVDSRVFRYVVPYDINPEEILTSRATLFVGNLDPRVTEAMLYEKFQPAGEIASIRICRDVLTKASLGYAYINFTSRECAELALDSMNFEIIKGNSMRVMWSQRNPALRRSGVGNVFIKNLDKEIDNKAMYDTFSTFGNILSCKVATDENGISKGFGFVHFENEESADLAIEKVNKMMLKNKKVSVGKFVPRTEREKQLGPTTRKFNNVYIKNFGEALDEEKLYEMFSKFGKICSHTIIKNEDGTSKGFGFVSFEDFDAAEAAVRELNNTELNGKSLYVGRAQKKDERQNELKKRFNLFRCDRHNRFHGVNLYVKNLDENMDDDALRQSFSPYGTITSAKVMKEGDRSKLFGFVCFSSREEAARAVTEMNGRILDTKPLYVAIAQKKEERKAHLAAQHVKRLNTGGMRHANHTYHQNGTSYFIPQLPHHQRLINPQVAPVRSRWPQPFMQNIPQVRSIGNQSVTEEMLNSYLSVRPYVASTVPNSQVRAPLRSMAAAPGSITVPVSSALLPATKPVPIAHAGNRAPLSYRLYNVQNPSVSSDDNNLPSQPSQPSQSSQRSAEQQTVPASEQTTLTASVLAGLSPQVQKQVLGEKLFPIIAEFYPEHASKITGMLLEINNSDLLQYIEDKVTLRAKAEDAFAVLQAHQVKNEVIASKKDK